MNMGFDTLQDKYEGEVIEIMSMIEDPLVSTSLFRKRMVSLLCSNVKLYHEIFGAEFIGWLKWMLATNEDRFKNLMSRTVALAETHHIQFLQRFCNFGISGELGEYLAEQIQVSNLSVNFVSGPLLPNRVEVFIEHACRFAGKWYLKLTRNMELGYCPVFNLTVAEYYPMSLISLVKMAFQGLEI
jgi:hypothetical protein